MQTNSEREARIIKFKRRESPNSQVVRGRECWEESLENKAKVPRSKIDNMKILSEERKMALKEEDRRR